MKILNFGSCNIDYVYTLSHIVRVGETLGSDKMETFAGGKGLNQSIALSRAGAKVYHAGCVGSDGGMLVDLLRTNGVDVSNVKTVDSKNGHAIIQVSRGGENCIFLYAGSNSMISKAHIDTVLDGFDKGDILLLQNEINNLKYIVEKAYKKGMCIILNPSPINEKIFEIDFNMLSYIILNEVEAKDITGASLPEKSIDYFKGKYPKLRVMLTLGENGCVYSDSEKNTYHPIFETDVVDTTAAGDTFTGYFVAGISEDRPIEEILKTACLASAIAVSRHGAAPSIPFADEVNEKMEIMQVKNYDKKSERILNIIRDYVWENLSDITLEKLAKRLDYSTVYTGSLIKKLMGMTYKKYIQKKRLEFAEQLLCETELSVGEIIRMAGYENESYFRSKFKEKYNKNPLEYRKGKRI